MSLIKNSFDYLVGKEVTVLPLKVAVVSIRWIVALMLLSILIGGMNKKTLIHYADYQTPVHSYVGLIISVAMNLLIAQRLSRRVGWARLIFLAQMLWSYDWINLAVNNFSEMVILGLIQSLIIILNLVSFYLLFFNKTTIETLKK